MTTTLSIPATKEQKRDIHMNVHKEVKEEFVQWATADVTKTSCNDLTFDQANRILVQNNRKPHKLAFRAKFDKNNSRHKYLLSLCIQYGWWQVSKKFGKVADLDQLNAWMHSDKCPVKKALTDMDNDELTKVIGALSKMTVKRYSNSKKAKQ